MQSRERHIEEPTPAPRRRFTDAAPGPEEKPPVRLLRHDRLQAELEVELFTTDFLAEAIDYQLDVWYHLPPEVGIGPAQNSVSSIYENMRVFSRLKTPPMRVADLVRLDGEGSPLAALSVLADNRRTPFWGRDVRREARLTPRVLRSAAQKHLEAAVAMPADEDAVRLLTDICQAGEAVGSRFRDICVRLGKHPLTANTRGCLEACDEYLSLQLELLATRALVVLKERNIDAPILRVRLTALARREAAWRRDHGLRSQLPETDDAEAQEAFLDQAGLLKRYVERVLLLKASSSRSHDLARNLILGAAAAGAMTWAVGLQIFTFYALGLDLAQGAGTNLVLTFAAVAVGGYILKDRLKAWIADRLSRQLPRFLDDRRTELHWGDAETPIAQVAERLTFEDADELEPEVHSRHAAAMDSPLVGHVQDDVLHYQRRIRVLPRAAVEHFPRFAGIHEDIRINVGRWVSTLASPRRSVAVLDKNDEPTTRKLPNRYAVSVVTRLRTRVDGRPGEECWSVHRLLLTQRGIARIERLDGDDLDRPPAPGGFV